MKNQFNVNKLIATVCGVDLLEFEKYLAKGTKPTKILTRMGVEPRLVSLVGGLKVAYTAEEIDAVYFDESIRSCMTGKPVGEFYEMNGIALLYTKAFRVLIGAYGQGIAPRGYGYQNTSIYPLVKDYFQPDVYEGPGRHFNDFITIKEREGGKEEKITYVVVRLTDPNGVSQVKSYDASHWWSPAWVFDLPSTASPGHRFTFLDGFQRTHHVELLEVRKALTSTIIQYEGLIKRPYLKSPPGGGVFIPYIDFQFDTDSFHVCEDPNYYNDGLEGWEEEINL